jgi:hypothetical protein
MSRLRTRLATAAAAGIALAACLGALALTSGEAGAARRKRPPRTPEARRDAASEAAADAARPAPPRPVLDAGTLPRPVPLADSGSVCLYGLRRDPRTGSFRCLSPEELDPPLVVIPDTRALAEQIGMLHGPEPGAAQQLAADASAAGDADPDAADAQPSGEYRARVVSVTFENGVVGRAHKALESKTDEMAECVAAEGGLKSHSARLKVLFLVRARGRPEGLIVASARNVPPKVVRCITRIIEAQNVGAPSNDPVGVTVLVELKEPDPDAA